MCLTAVKNPLFRLGASRRLFIHQFIHSKFGCPAKLHRCIVSPAYHLPLDSLPERRLYLISICIWGRLKEVNTERKTVCMDVVATHQASHQSDKVVIKLNSCCVCMTILLLLCGAFRVTSFGRSHRTRTSFVLIKSLQNRTEGLDFSLLEIVLHIVLQNHSRNTPTQTSQPQLHYTDR